MADYNYIVGPIRGNQQTISIQHKYNGDGQVVVSTPERIDEYVKKMKKAPMQDEIACVSITALGGVMGHLAGLLAKAKEGGVYGALLGALVGLTSCLFIPGKQERLTKEFLKNNVQGE